MGKKSDSSGINDKLIANLKLGLTDLEQDVIQANKLLGEINQGKDTINLNLKIGDIKASVFSEIVDMLKKVETTFDQASAKANKFAQSTQQAGASLKEAMNNANAGNAPQLINRSITTTKDNTIESSTYVDSEGRKIKIIANAKNDERTKTVELKNATTEFNRALNTVNATYSESERKQKNNIQNIKATIAEMERLKSHYNPADNEYIKLDNAQRLYENKLETARKAQIQAPLSQATTAYNMLSPEERQNPANLSALITAHEEVIKELQKEGFETVALSNKYKSLQDRYDKLTASMQKMSKEEEIIYKNNKNLEGLITSYKTGDITPQQFLGASQDFAKGTETGNLISDQNRINLRQQEAMAINKVKMEEEALRRERERQDYAPIKQAINSYNSLDASLSKSPAHMKEIINQYDKMLVKYKDDLDMTTKLTKERKVWSDEMNRSTKSATEALEKMNKSTKSGLFSTNGLLGSGDARANFADKFTNSLSYMVSGSIIGGFTTGLFAGIQAMKDYEQGLIDLSRTMNNVTQKDLKMLGEYAINTSKEFGLPLKEIQSAMTELARAGIDTPANLKTLTSTVALGLNTTEIKDASTMTAYLVSTIKQLGLEYKDSMEILDKWNYLADKYAVKADDFAKAIQKSGSASKQLGADLDLINAMVVVLGERTQASGEEIGNAIKSLENHILRPETVKTLEGYGIVFQKNAQQYNDFRDIITQVNTALNTFEENSIDANTILDAIGGAWRKNWVSILAENWNEVKKIESDAKNILGYSANENVKVMETFSKKLEVLKSTASEMAVSFANSGLLPILKDGVDLLKYIVEQFTKLPTSAKSFLVNIAEVFLIIKGIGLALRSIGVPALHTMFNSGLSTLLLSLNKTKLEINGITKGLEYLELQFKKGNIEGSNNYLLMREQLNQGKSVTTTEVGLKNSKTQQEALNIAQKESAKNSLLFSVGWTIAITVVIGALTALLMSWKSQKELQDKTIESLQAGITKSIDATNELRENTKYYEENYDKINTNIEIRNRMLEIQSQLKGTYGEEAKSLDLINGKYNETSKLLTDINNKQVENELKSKKAIADFYLNQERTKPVVKQKTNLLDVDTWGALWGDAKYEVVPQKSLEKPSIIDYINDPLLLFGSKYKPSQYTDKPANKITLTDELKAVDDILLAIGTRDLSIFDKPIMEKLSIEIPKTETEWVNLITVVKQYREEISKQQIAVDNAMIQQQATIRQQIISENNMTGIQQNLWTELLGKTDIPDINSYKIVAEQVASIMNQFDPTKIEFTINALKEIPALKGIDFDQFFDKEKLIALQKALTYTKKELDAIKALQDKIQTQQKYIDLADKAAKELETGGKLKRETQFDIINERGDLAGIINDKNALTVELKKMKDTALKDQQDLVNKQLEINIEYYNKSVKGNKALWQKVSEAYPEDAKKFLTIAQLKARIDTKLREFLGKEWQKFYNKDGTVSDEYIDKLKKMSDAWSSMAKENPENKYIQGIANNLTKQYEVAKESADIIKGIPKVTFNVNTDDAKTLAVQEKIFMDRYIQLNALKNGLQSKVDLNTSKLENATITEKNILLQDQINLYQHLQNNTHDFAEEYRRERATLEPDLQNFGFKLVGEGDSKYIANLNEVISKQTDYVNSLRTSTDTTAYNNAKKILDEMIRVSSRFFDIQSKEIPAQQKAWFDYANTLKQFAVTAKMVWIDYLLEASEKAQSYIDWQLEMTGNNVEKQNEIKRLKRKQLENDITNQINQLNMLIDTTDKARQSDAEFIKGRDNLSKTLEGNLTKLSAMNDEMSNSYTNTLNSTEQKIIDMINKGIELEKKALTDKLTAYKEYVSKILDEQDKLNAEQDYAKRLTTEKNKALDLQRKINAIAYDSSIEGFQKRAELTKAYNEQQDAIATLENERRRQISKDNLNAGVTYEEDVTNKALLSFDTTYTELEKKNMAYRALINKDFSEIQNKLPILFKELGTETTNFFTVFESYEKKFGSWIGNFADDFNNNVLPNIKESIRVVNEAIDRMKDPYDWAREQSANATNSKGQTKPNPLIEEGKKAVAKAEENNIQITAKPVASVRELDLARNYIKNRQNTYYDNMGNPEYQAQLNREAQAMRDKYGLQWEDLRNYESIYATFDGGINKGLATKTGKYLLHGTPENPEWVLTNQQMFSLVKNLGNNLSLGASTTGSGGGIGDINLSINVEGNADKNTVNGITNAGKAIVTEMKKELNKLGIFK